MVSVLEDLTGRAFGLLTVVKQTEDYITPNGRHHAKWECICSCEEHNTIHVLGTNLRNGNTTSCGCIHKAEDLTGLKFGHLTVLARDKDRIQPSGQHKSMWKCQCDCDRQTIIIARGDHLRRHKISSCGNCGNRYDLTGSYGICYLSDNSKCLFDKEDYNKIKNYTWCKTGKEGYVSTRITDSNGNNMQIQMHRLIMSAPDGTEVDHIHHNTLDNRKSELRVVTKSQNQMNRRISSNNSSGTTGVYYCKNAQKWRATIQKNKKSISLGCFDDINDAITARKRAEQEFFGEFAYIQQDEYYELNAEKGDNNNG